MRTRSSSNLPGESSLNPTSSDLKRRNHRRSKQPFILEESPVDTMADQHTMAELLRAPTEGYAEAIVAWDRYKDLLRACPHHGFTELHQLDTFYNALNPADQDSLNSAAGGNLLERRTQDVLTIIENKSKDNIQGYVSAAAVNYNQEEDERVEETSTDLKLGEFTIKVPPPLVQKPKPPSQRNYVAHQRDPLHPNIPYPSRMHKQKQQEKDEKIIKALLSNKNKLLELVNTPLNENCSLVILKKLPEKLKDPGKFLIPCGFSELKCKALDDLEPNDNLFDTIPEMFTDEHALDYSSPPLYDDYDDDLDEFKSDTVDIYNDPFDSKGKKIKESKLLIDELDLPRSSDFLPSPEYDSFLFEDFSKVDALPSTNNDDKVFNPCILIHENLSKDTVQAIPDKNEFPDFEDSCSWFVLRSPDLHILSFI
nr:reverse transcriptase domain-containing protein [Tanacetum cinerariifolium]